MLEGEACGVKGAPRAPPAPRDGCRSPVRPAARPDLWIRLRLGTFPRRTSKIPDLENALPVTAAVVPDDTRHGPGAVLGTLHASTSALAAL